ncbi:MAG: hypothetical protein JO348_12565 [Alphaproteobacteria bacterium]|nr:hypothetical protein [Alphaproteobacteria bacterium]
MRTTLTLDPDNAVRLERLQKERDAAFKDVVNEAIRRGLDVIDNPRRPRVPFQVPVVNSGVPLIENVDDVAEVIALIEGEDHR